MLSVLVGMYSFGYISRQPMLLSSLPFFPLLVASMAAVVCARDGFFFLVVWEVMSLASFVLVATEHERREVREAGWIYLVATHVATVFLVIFFVLLFQKTGSFSFKAFTMNVLSPQVTGMLFLLALVGFGTKAGIFPLHVWLPHAHPAAPSYISALMSGIMIKTGIYGLLRTLTFLKTPPIWLGESFIGVGVLSAVLGVLYALMQHDLKRFLAYHSVENIGIIVIGIGLGLMGITLSKPTLSILGFGGALFHVWNHALFKGLLFLGAGNVFLTTHVRVMDRLGGLLKTMPMTGITFLIASMAICALPPLNGFISEWLIYFGLFKGVSSLKDTPLFFLVTGIIGTAFAGGLAIACFTKVCGVVFLGEPRNKNMQASCEVSKDLLTPMFILAFFCVVFGIYPQGIWSFIFAAVEPLVPFTFLVEKTQVITSLTSLSKVVSLALFLFVLFAFVVRWVFKASFMQKQVTVTWDCAYTEPTPRMQYTASSFAQPLEHFFLALFKPHIDQKNPYTEDLAERLVFRPLFSSFLKRFLWIQKLQGRRIQGYLAFIFGTLLVLLLWEVWIGI